MYSNKKIIYADNSATTRVRDEVAEVMLKVLKEDFGNPSSIHSFGRTAKSYLEEARENIASLINAKADQIFFTSGGTESINTVIFGVSKLIDEGFLKNKDRHIITTKIEHPAVKESLEYLEKKGWNITWLNVDKEGFINLEELKSKISQRTLLVSIIHANNEIGTIQDLKKISEICNKNNVLFHTDAIQSFGKIPIDVNNLNIDFISMSGHKIYGPKGIGAVYIKSVDKLSPILIGGGQENKVRPGTENIAGIAGFGTAAKLISNEILFNAQKLRRLQIQLIERFSEVQNVIVTGSNLDKVKENVPDEKFTHRIAGHVSICCKDTEGESLVLQADLKGIAVSSGSACSSKTDDNSVIKPSHVLIACGIPKDYVRGSLRITLGKDNSEDEIAYIFETMKNILNIKKGNADSLRHCEEAQSADVAIS